MISKIITVEIRCSDEDTWKESKKDIEEIMSMMKTLKREARILQINNGGSENDGKDE